MAVIPDLTRLLSSLLLWALCVSVYNGEDSTIAAADLVDVLKPGSSLTPSASPAALFSSSSVFMLSFVSPPNSTNLFLAISYVLKNSSSSSTAAGYPPVWVANRNVPVTSSASLTLSTSGNLLLSDSTVSPALIWSSNTADPSVLQAQLLDSGNLVLLNGSSGYVWESFHYPTDTLLPGQSFTAFSTSLMSNKNSNGFTPGRFSLRFTRDSTLQLVNTELQSAEYWYTRNVTAFRFDKAGNITFYNSSSYIQSAYVSSDHGNEDAAIRRMTLDMDGNLRLYTWDTASTQWQAVWMAFTNVCTRMRGLCGSYGVCTYDPVQPTCVCPQGFSVVDATDLAGGCRANYKIVDQSGSCRNSTKLVEIAHVDFPENDYLNYSFSSLEECKNQCLSSCECVAAVYWQSQGHCWLKEKLEHGAIKWSQKHRTFLKISDADPSMSRPVIDKVFTWSSLYLWQDPPVLEYIKSTRKHFGTVIGLAILLTIQTVGFAAIIVVLITRSKLTHLRYGAQLDEELKGSLHVFSYEELKAASENFHHRIGAGAFGTVYKGQLQNGKPVAIKRVEGLSEQQEQQFRAEILTLGKIHHINLLPLVGFCAEGSHRLLVYAYMENGSLDRALLQRSTIDNPEEINVLDWSTRFQICLGVARGIHYLHTECSDCILHCDIKPENVLLDASYCPKVADFGLAYLYSRNHTLKMSKTRGTRGYLAPEWVSNLPITAKADVYSYGMLIMEILSGRRNFVFSESCLMDEKWFFPKWADGKRIEEVVDAGLNRLSVDWEQAELVLKVGFACIQTDMSERPSMGMVVKILEGTLPVPDAAPPSPSINEDEVAQHTSASSELSSITSSATSYHTVL